MPQHSCNFCFFFLNKSKYESKWMFVVINPVPQMLSILFNLYWVQNIPLIFPFLTFCIIVLSNNFKFLKQFLKLNLKGLIITCADLFHSGPTHPRAQPPWDQCLLTGNRLQSPFWMDWSEEREPVSDSQQEQSGSVEKPPNEISWASNTHNT